MPPEYRCPQLWHQSCLRNLFGLRFCSHTVLRMPNHDQAMVARRDKRHPSCRKFRREAALPRVQSTSRVLMDGGGEFAYHPAADVTRHSLRDDRAVRHFVRAEPPWLMRRQKGAGVIPGHLLLDLHRLEPTRRDAECADGGNLVGAHARPPDLIRVLIVAAI